MVRKCDFHKTIYLSKLGKRLAPVRKEIEHRGHRYTFTRQDVKCPSCKSPVATSYGWHREGDGKAGLMPYPNLSMDDYVQEILSDLAETGD